MEYENKYLVKVANRLKDHLKEKGQNVEGISSSSLNAKLPPSKDAGSFGGMSNKARKLGDDLTPKQGFASKFQKAIGQTQGSAGAKARKEGLNQSGKTLNDALKSHAQARAAREVDVASKAGKGFLPKAIGFVKKNPLLASGGALASGLLAGKAFGKSDPSQNYSNYQ